MISDLVWAFKLGAIRRKCQLYANSKYYTNNVVTTRIYP